MSSFNPKSAGMARDKHRDQSADAEQTRTHPVPGPRQIPLPEFYPTERTSTASFKAPVTASALAAKKKLEVPPPPPPGTLGTAMNYLSTSTPVKYFSSMFTKPAPPEPVKVKERVFKIDLEKLEKEKQASPKPSTSLKKVQNIIEETSGKSAPVLQAEKNKESAWRRKNMMDVGYIPPLSPKPSKFRSQSPSTRRLASIAAVPTDLSPTNMSQLKIASSSAQNSFKVVSKYQKVKEEPEKKKKKDLRNVRNGRTVKDMKDIPMLTRYNPPLPSKYTSAPSNPMDDLPIVRFPTVLPPRVPPATYTIRSTNPLAEEDIEGVKEQALMLEPEAETATGPAALLASASNEQTGLVACDGPTVLQFHGTSIDLESEPKLEETLGSVEGGPAQVTRLDQLPSGQLGNMGGQNSLKSFFRDATLMRDDIVTVGNHRALSSSPERPVNIMLCAASTRYSSLENLNFRSGDTKKTPAKASYRQQDHYTREMSTSPVRKIASPILLRSESKEQRSKPPAYSYKDSVSKSHQRESKKSHYQSDASWKSNQLVEMKANSSKDVAYKGRGSESPAGRNGSPLRVDDKYKAIIEEKLGNWRRSRPSSNTKTVVKESASSPDRTKAASVVQTKPNVNVIKKATPRPKDSSPEKPAASKALNAAAVTTATAAAAAAASAAATAIASSVLQKQPSPPKSSSVQKPTSDMDKAVARESEPAPHRSPPSAWKMEKEGIFKTGSPSPVPVSPKPKDDLAHHSSVDSPAQNSPKTQKPTSFRDMVRQNIMPMDKAISSSITAQTVANADAESQNQPIEDVDELNCVENYCGDPSKFPKAATMMGEFP